MTSNPPAVEELKQEIEQSSNLLTGKVPDMDWHQMPVKKHDGRWCYPAKPDVVKSLGFPNPRKWKVEEEDWELPENWEQIIFEGMRDRLKRFRSFKLFMDVCVRCGACADKCHFFLGTGDPKNINIST